MQKTMDQSAAIKDSQELHTSSLGKREEKHKIASEDSEKKEMRQKIIGMEMEIERQTLVYIDDKMKWERQRNRMQKEMERYKFLSYKRQTNNSSAQTNSEWQSDVMDHTTPYKCCQCCKSFLDEDSLKYHEDVHCDKRQQFDCTVCEKQFQQKADLDSHDATVHTPVRARRKELLKHLKAVETAIACRLPLEDRDEAREQAIREEYEFKYKKYPKPKETNAQKLGPNIQKPLFFVQNTTAANVEETAKALQDKLRVSKSKKSSSVPASAAPESKAQTRIPIDDHAREQLQQQFTSMLENHSCKNLKCSIIAFNNYVTHVNEGCFYGREDCTWYICERIKSRTKHLKKCKDKTQCKICQPYVYFNEAKLHGLVSILEKRCSQNQEHTSLTIDALMATVARLAVNYGLVGDNEKIAEDTKTLTELKETCNSKCSSGSSSDSSSPLDDEGILDEWELVESELLTRENDQVEKKKSI